MTGDLLISYVEEHHVLKALKVQVEPIEIYRAHDFAQAEILRECELIEHYPSPTLTAAQEVYHASDSGWEFLKKTVRIKHGYHATGMQLIQERGRQWVDTQRFATTQGANQPQPPRYFYHTLENPIGVGFWGIPQQETVVNFTAVRGHDVASDGLSKTVPSLAVAGFEELWMLGTVTKLLEMRRTWSHNKSESRRFVPDEYTLATQDMRAWFNAQKQEAKITRTTIGDEHASLQHIRMP